MKKAKTKNWYYTILRVAKTELGMSEDDYRLVLEGFGATEKSGKISASTMTIPQLEKAVTHFKSLGFKPRRTGTLSHKQGLMNKIIKLWSLLHEANVMRQPYSSEAASKFAFNITKANRIEWATPNNLTKVVEALKGMARREGVEIEHN